MNSVRFIVHGAPVAKGRGRAGNGNVVYTPEKTRKYENTVGWCAAQAMAGELPFDAPCRMTLRAYVAIPQSWSLKKQAAAERGEVVPGGRPDLDNFLKAALDGINQIVVRDDSLVVRIEASKTYDRKPRLEIEIETFRERAA